MKKNTIRCPQCQEIHPPETNFCTQCGANMTVVVDITSQIMQPENHLDEALEAEPIEVTALDTLPETHPGQMQMPVPVGEEINLPAPESYNPLTQQRVTLPSVPAGALVSGIVTSVTADEPMAQHYDLSQLLTRLAIVGALLGGLSLFLYSVSWWMIAGFFATLILFTILMRSLGVLARILGQIVSIGVPANNGDGLGPRGFNWSVLDPQTRQVTSGRLVRRRAAPGHLSPGDMVSVYGRRQRNNLVEAKSIIITQHVGNPTWSKIEGASTWPLWIGISAWAIVLGGLYGLALYLGLL